MPEIRFQDGATLRNISAIRYQDGATLRTIQKAYYQDGATLRLVWQAYTPMTGSMADVSGTTNWGTSNQTVGTATASVSGGNPSKTYTFAKYSGATTHFDIFPSGANCTVKVHGNPAKGTYNMTLRCIVTDGTGSLTLYCNIKDVRI